MNNKQENIIYFFLFLLLTNFSFSYSQTDSVSLKDSEGKNVQYRRGAIVRDSFQSYDEKYNGKDLNEEKNKLFPLELRKDKLLKSENNSGTWTELNPKVPRVDYLGIHFINKDTGWAVGDLGTVIKTIDGGETWETITTGINTVLTHINCFNESVIIAVGYQGKIIRSENGGETWDEITTSATQDLWRVEMLNDSLGWICGKSSTLLKTTDGGLSWQNISTGFAQNYWSLDFINKELGYIACGNGYLLKTTNGGSNWQQINIGEDVVLYCVTVLDTQTVVAGGFTRIATTYDGGDNWNIVGLGGVFYSIAFNDSLNGIALSDASVYRTTDRGMNWNYLFGSPSAHNWVIFVDSFTGYYAGNGLKIQKTIDGGVTWKQLILNDNFYDVHFINETTGFIVSGSQYKTTDSGVNWQKQEGKPGGFSIKFIDSLTGFIGNNNGSIFKTTDEAETWYSTNFNTTVGPITKFFFIDDSVGWALGSKVLKTTDRGESWVIKGNGGTSIFFIDHLVGWITRINGRPYKTTDGGDTWIEQIDLNIWESRDIFFKDISNGFILESNKLYNTTDAGINWELNPEITGFSVAARFSWFENSIIFITGYNTYCSIDGGNNWTEFNLLTGTRINSFNLIEVGNGYAVGGNGLIIKYFDSTYIPVELISFNGKRVKNTVILNWETATELNNNRFEIERYITENYYWKTIGFVEGKGTTTEKQYYTFIDKNLREEKYRYRLKQIDFDGTFKYSNVVEIEMEIPSKNYLSQNYPNPFNPETNIEYIIQEETLVNISLFDVKGEKVLELVNEEKQPGFYTIKLKGNELSTGVYFYRLKTNSGYSSVKKLIIVK